MVIIVAGSRSITEAASIDTAIRQSGFPVTEVVSGTPRGADQLGEAWAMARNVPVRRFPADWQRYGRAAGMRRNEVMARYAAAAPEGGGLVAVWDGRSPGTKYMIDFARQHGLAVHVQLVKPA